MAGAVTIPVMLTMILLWIDLQRQIQGVRHHAHTPVFHLFLWCECRISLSRGHSFFVRHDRFAQGKQLDTTPASGKAGRPDHFFLRGLKEAQSPR